MFGNMLHGADSAGNVEETVYYSVAQKLTSSFFSSTPLMKCMFLPLIIAEWTKKSMPLWPQSVKLSSSESISIGNLLSYGNGPCQA